MCYYINVLNIVYACIDHKDLDINHHKLAIQLSHVNSMIRIFSWGKQPVADCPVGYFQISQTYQYLALYIWVAQTGYFGFRDSPSVGNTQWSLAHKNR